MTIPVDRRSTRASVGRGRTRRSVGDRGRRSGARRRSGPLGPRRARAALRRGRAGARTRCRSSCTTRAVGARTRSHRKLPIASTAAPSESVRRPSMRSSTSTRARGALLIAEFATRHRDRDARLGPHRHAHLGRSERVPRRGLLRGGEGRARELHDVGGDRARADGHHRQRRVPAGDRHRMGDRRRPPLRGRERRPCARRHSATRWPR